MKTRIFWISLAIIFTAIAGSAVFSQEQTIAPEEAVTISDLGVLEPKILPTNPLYFFKEIGRGLQSFFTFNPVAKAELELKFANEKAAETKKIIETQPSNTRAIQKALENYQETQTKLREKFEKLSETSQNPKVDILMDNLTQKAVKHEKLFDEISFRFGEKEEVSQAIKNAKEGSENLMGEASKKDEPAKFASRLEKVLLEENGGDLKHARSVEIIDKFSNKAPAETKESLGRLREEFSEKLEQDIQGLLEKEGENTLEQKIVNTPGDIAARSVIIEEIQKRAEERLAQALGKAMEQLESQIQKEKDIAQKARGQIEQAEKVIQEGDTAISQNADANVPQVVTILLTEAKGNLENAKSAIGQEKYGEAFGQARSSEVLARNALRFFGKEKPQTENFEKQLKELEEKIRTYENLIKNWGLNTEQTQNAHEILNNNAVTQLRDAKEALANGDLEKTKMDVDYIRKTFLKLSNILERKTALVAPEVQQIKPAQPVLPAVSVVSRCEEIQKLIIELKNLLSSGKISEPDFKEKYDARLRELIVCQEEKNILPPATPVAPKPVAPEPVVCTFEYAPVCGSNGKTYSNKCFAKNAEVAISYEGECRPGEKESPPAIVPGATNTLLRIISPNGGEQWTIGNTYTIQWENPGNVKSVYVELYKGGAYLSGLGGLGYNWGAPSSWAWNTIDTPNFESGSDFKIRIRSDADKTIYDESDNYFSISAPAISPAGCNDLKSGTATNNYFELCKKGGFDRVCFNKYYSTYQGCGRSTEYDSCTISNVNAEKNILCDTGLVYTCSDSDKMNYNAAGQVSDAGKNYTDYCVDSSVVKEYYCSFSDSHTAGIVSEENYTCPAGCENGACKIQEKLVPNVPLESLIDAVYKIFSGLVK